MKAFGWDREKNEWLKAHRGVSFEQVVERIANGDVLGVEENRNQGRYPGQRIFVVELNGYAYLVPFVESENEIFLKTIIPSRRATRTYLKRGERHG